MTTKELIAEINDLPVDQRIKIATQILEGLTPPDPGVEKRGRKRPGNDWIITSKGRQKRFPEIK